MSHVLILHPDLSPIAPDRDRVPFHADPILAASERHDEVYAAFQVALEGEASRRAEDEYEASRDALLGTSCATRFGAFVLIRHLHWWLGDEAGFADSYQPHYAIAQASEADLSRFLGVEPIQRIPTAMPSGRLCAPLALPAPPAVACRFLALVAGGCLLTGLATLI